jgi:hypothetical protein
MSRRAREEMPFGSDSFLDVLANIVGILIILIVAAAARMGRVPDPVRLAQSVAPQAADPDPTPAQPETPPDPQPAPVASEPESDDPPPEIAAELAAISGRLTALADKTLATETRLKKLRSSYDSARQALGDDDKQAAERADKLKAAQERVARLEEALGERKQTLTGLLAEFEEAQKTKPPAIQVRHKLSPVSQEIAGEELHFCVSGGKVTVVPLANLVERVKIQLERQKDWLATRARHEAVVGPVDGYSMSFLVEKKPLSSLDRRRLGYGGYRIGISHWELIPEPDLAGETPERALRRGSKFAMAVKTAPDNAALTFWVYPDSFHAYRILQAACQSEGFLVAARPLPFGIRIAGSPEGTRSAGQ